MKINWRILLWTAMAILVALLVSCSKARAKNGAKAEKLAGSPSDPPVELKLKWTPGNRYLLRMEMTRSARRQQRGHSDMVSHEFSFNQDYALTVTNAGAQGNRGLSLEILSLETSTTVGDNCTLNFDSESQVDTGTDNSISDLLRQSIGSHLYYLLAPNGRILKVSGVRELLQTGSNGPVSSALRRVYNPEYFKEILELCSLPEGPVKVGDSWAFKRETTVGSSTFSAEGTCTFKGWQDHEKHKCAVIDVDGTLRPRTRAPRIVQGTQNQVSFISPEGQSGQTPLEPAKGDASSPRPSPPSDGGEGELSHAVQGVHARMGWANSLPELTNQLTRNYASAANATPGIEDGKITGTIWFDADLGLPVETSLEESYATKVWRASRQTQTNAPPKGYTSPISQKLSFKLVDAAPATP